MRAGILVNSVRPMSHLTCLKVAENAPVWCPLRWMPVKHNEAVRKEFKAVLAARIIKPAPSPWEFAIVIAKKKDVTHIFCVDYQALNKRIKADMFSLPTIEEVINDMTGSIIFSKLDMLTSYWLIRLGKNVRQKTTLRSKLGSFHFVVRPLRLIKAPYTFQRIVESELKNPDFV